MKHRSIEIEAKTTKEAINIALKRLKAKKSRGKRAFVFFERTESASRKKL